MAGFKLLRFPEAASLGLHAMAHLAKNPQTSLSNQAIADRLGGSKHHLAKVTQRLAKSGLLQSGSGPRGGFRLARRADEITLLEICEATEGPLDAPGCLLEAQACDGTRDCLLGSMIQSISQQMCTFLTSTTLADLAGNVGIHGISGGSPAQDRDH